MRGEARVRRLVRRRPAVALGNLGALRAVARRTRAVRLGMAAALVSLLAGAALTADSGHARSDIVPEGTTSVLVIDLSKSIIESEFQPIAATLRRLIATDTPTGLVVFSDVAYELLPPGAPASALPPLLRLFTPHRGKYPANPWQATFRAGTKISVALDLADSMLTRDSVANGSIVLASDLETASSDFAALSSTLSQLKREHVVVRVVALRPTQRARNLFRSLLGPGYLLPEPKAVPTDAAPEGTTLSRRLPRGLVVLAALLLLALAANERWCARLALPSARGESA